MTLHIDDPELDALVQKLAEVTGESPAEAVKIAVKEQLERVHPRSKEEKMARIMAIAAQYAAKPVVDTHFTEDSLYDERGLPA